MKRMLLVVVMALAAGCATGSAGSKPEGGEKPQIALNRGGSWSTIGVALPNINGPTMELQLKDNQLIGFVGGAPLDVHIEGDRVSGRGPSGMVEVTFDHDQGGMKVEGMWNGGPIHFNVSPGGLEGTVVWRMGQKFAGQQTCAYDLRTTSAPGVLAGTSACGNMSVGSRLEIDQRIPAMMSPTELGLVLVAALASPP